MKLKPTRRYQGRKTAQKREFAVKVYFTETEDAALRAQAEIENKTLGLVLRESWMRRHRQQGAPIVAGQSVMAFDSQGEYLGIATQVDGKTVITP